MPPPARVLFDTVLDVVYPPRCLLCTASLADGRRPFMLCDSCTLELTQDPSASWARCASTSGPGVDTREGCPSCRNDSFAFASAFRLGIYAGKLQDAILAMKHLPGEALAETVGRLWTEHSATRFWALQSQVVVPVPLHFVRRMARGYNQSESLAWMIALGLGVPCHPRWLRRIRNTPMQTSQSRAARRENLRGAFRAAKFARFTDQRVLLIDDVLTTGATADAAARALRDAGALRVDVAILAHR